MKVLKVILDVIGVIVGLALIGFLIWLGVSLYDGIADAIKSCNWQ